MSRLNLVSRLNVDEVNLRRAAHSDPDVMDLILLVNKIFFYDSNPICRFIFD